MKYLPLALLLLSGCATQRALDREQYSRLADTTAISIDIQNINLGLSVLQGRVSRLEKIDGPFDKAAKESLKQTDEELKDLIKLLEKMPHGL